MEQWKEDFLAHHGVLGMKWGIRRYQNEDGSYTKVGKKRYGIGEQKKPKHYARRLNDLDVAMTYHRYGLSKDHYAINRLNKKASKKSLSERDKANLDRIINSKKHAEQMILKGIAETNKILHEANKSGYIVTSREYERAVEGGGNYIVTMKGTTYKVKDLK